MALEENDRNLLCPYTKVARWVVTSIAFSTLRQKVGNDCHLEGKHDILCWSLTLKDEIDECELSPCHMQELPKSIGMPWRYHRFSSRPLL